MRKAEIKRKINVRGLQFREASSEVTDGDLPGKIMPGNCFFRVFFAVLTGRDTIEAFESTGKAFGACIAIVQGNFKNVFL